MLGTAIYVIVLIPEIAILGFGIAMIARAKRGKATTLGVVGCIVLLVGALLNAAQTILMPNLAEELGYSRINVIFMVLAFVHMAIFCVGIGLLIWSAASRNPVHAQTSWQPGGDQPGWQQPQQGPGWQPQQQPHPGWQPQQPPQAQQPPQQQGWQQPQQPYPGQQPPPPGQGY